MLRDCRPLLFEDPGHDAHRDPSRWKTAKEALAALFKTRTRAAWCALLEGKDACFAPVLSLSEAPSHPHNVARGVFTSVDGVVQPAPAPRFSRTPSRIRKGASAQGADTTAVLRDWGYTAAQIDEWRAAQVIA